MWLGLESTYAAEALPHTTKIKRKPRGVGVELKAICCSHSNIMLRVEIMEGKEAQQRKQWRNRYNEGTAVTLHLASNYGGSWRTVVGDSAFASVNCAVALRNELQLNFQGIVKTARREFPLAYLMNWFNEGNQAQPRRERGSHIVLQSNFQDMNNGHDVPVYALGWHEKKLKTIISTRGTSVEVDHAQRKRHRITVDDRGQEVTETYIIYVKRCEMVKTLYDAFSCIDIHDHYRQGLLCMEESWRTKQWMHRLFASLFGVIVTDSYFAYRANERMYQRPVMDYYTFLNKLVDQLVNNVFARNDRVTRNVILHQQNFERNLEDVVANNEHRLASLRSHPHYAGRNKKMVFSGSVPIVIRKLHGTA